MRYTKGFKYQLDGPELYNSALLGFTIDTRFYALTVSGVFLAKAGFAWDGCSGSIDTDTNMRAGLFHDIGCLMVAREELPDWAIKEINSMFSTILKQDGMNSIRRWAHTKAVELHFKRTSPSRRKVYEK